MRDDWGADSVKVRLTVHADRAEFAGVSNREVALSCATAMNGLAVTTLHEGDQRIPVLARLPICWGRPGLRSTSWPERSRRATGSRSEASRSSPGSWSATLVIVPVLYAIFVLDLRLVQWEAPPDTGGRVPAPETPHE